jgi:hypothetical protein
MYYLENLNGTLLTDLIVIGALLFGIIESNSLVKWYRLFGLGAILADVMIIMIGIIITQIVYPFVFRSFSLYKFVGLAILIQTIHDCLLALVVTSFPVGKSNIIDVFKEYIDENGAWILLADSLMMASAILIMQVLKLYSRDINIITLIILLYKVPYLLFSI